MSSQDSSPPPFEQLSERAQVMRLRRTASEVLRQYPVEVRSLRLLNHGYNTTFRVDTVDGRRFALRLNTNAHKSVANLHAEMAWLAALAADTDLRVPVPQATRDGRLHTEIPSPDLGRVLTVAMFGWLAGPDLAGRATPIHLHEVGRVAALLHQHAERWSLPPGAALMSFADVLPDTPNHLTEAHPELTPSRAAVVAAAYEQVERHLADLYDGARTHVLHADLHLGNLKWYRGRLSVFDFDDCGIGVAIQDLAMSAFYLRPRRELEDAMHEGYRSVRPLPVATAEQYEAVVASRDLVLLNDLLVTPTAELRDLLPRYAANSHRKLRHYLDTGTFRHDLPGVVPIW